MCISIDAQFIISMNALKCRTLRAMSSCHFGQTGQWQLTKCNLCHTGCLQRGKTIMHMHMLSIGNGRLRMAFNRGSAGSLQRSGFSEKPTKALTSIAC